MQFACFVRRERCKRITEHWILRFETTLKRRADTLHSRMVLGTAFNDIMSRTALRTIHICYDPGHAGCTGGITVQEAHGSNRCMNLRKARRRRHAAGNIATAHVLPRSDHPSLLSVQQQLQRRIFGNPPCRAMHRRTVLRSM